MEERPASAEQLLRLSSAARRIGELVAAAEAPLRYEVLRHLLRVSEETMTEVLDEAVAAHLARRAADPFTYVPASASTTDAILDGLGPDRLARLRQQIASASVRVFDT